MQKQSFEVSISFDDKDGIRKSLVKAALLGLRVKEEEIIEQDQNGQCSLSIYKKSSEIALKLKRKIHRLGLKQVKVQYQRIATKDWQTVWKENYKPFAITKNFKIVY